MFSSIKRALAVGAILFVSSLGVGNTQTLSSPAAKPWFIHLLLADVWPSGYSDVWLLDWPTSGHVVSNIDFQIFGPAVTVETADAIHDIIVICIVFTSDDVLIEEQAGNFDKRGVPKYWPAQLPPPTASGEYVSLPTYVGVLTPTNDLRVLDALHQYYRSNRLLLEAQAQQRAIDLPRILAEEAARRAAWKPFTGPPAFFKGIKYYPTPSPSPH